MNTTWIKESQISDKKKLVVTAVELDNEGVPTNIRLSDELDVSTTNVEEEVMKRVQRKVADYEDRLKLKADMLSPLIVKLDAVDNGDFTAYVREGK